MSKQTSKKSTRGWLLILLAVVAIAAVGFGWWALTANQKPTSDVLTEGGFEYRLAADGKTASIVRYVGEDTSVTVPTTLGGRTINAVEGLAFSWCKQVTDITLPEGILSLGNGVFYNCGALTSVSFPASLEKWGTELFMDCGGLKTVKVAEGNPSRRAVDGVLYSKDGKTLFTYPAGREDKTFTVPAEVTTLGPSAFEGATALTAITLPEGLTTVGDKAFFFCQGITELTFPETATNLGTYAFGNCASLAKVTLSTKLTVLPDFFFFNCGALKDITLPEGLTSIGQCAFQTCASLTKLDIPKTVQSFGTGALMECTALENAVIPDGVTFLPEFLFGYCLKLKEVDIPASVTDIHKNAFTACNEAVVLVGGKDDRSYTFGAERGLDFRIRGTDEVIDNVSPDKDE